MDKIKNVGQWTAIVKNEGKTPQLYVDGIVPTLGEKPIFKLTPINSDGINPTQLILVLENGNLVEEEGHYKIEVEQYNQALVSIDQYSTILVLDNSLPLRVLAQIDIIEVNSKKSNNVRQLTGTNIKGTVKIMTVPRDERDSGRRAAFLQFDSYSNIKGNISQEFLGKTIYAIATISNSEAVDLSEIILVSGGQNDIIPSSVEDGKFTVFGTIYKEHEGYRFAGGAYRLTSMEENLIKLKNKRILASGGFAQFHTEDGYFEAFLVEEYKILNSKNILNLSYTSNNNVLIDKLVQGSEITILKTFPPTLSINACGVNLTSGWENDFQLSPYYYILPPADGIYEFDFLGTPPSSNVPRLDVLTPCFANYLWHDFPKELKGVRIHSKGNSIELMCNLHEVLLKSI